MARRRLISATTLAIVVAGGMIGVAARAAIVLPLGPDAHPLAVPAATLAINLVGSLLLGIVVGWFDDRRPRLRAFFGTGVMGGFTTYSAFSVQTVQVFTDAPVTGLALAALSLVGGVIAGAIGLRIGRGIADVPGEVEPLEDAE